MTSNTTFQHYTHQPPPIQPTTALYDDRQTHATNNPRHSAVPTALNGILCYDILIPMTADPTCTNCDVTGSMQSSPTALHECGGDRFCIREAGVADGTKVRPQVK